MSIPTPVEFLTKRPLYSEVVFRGEQVWQAIEILYYDRTYDSYCVACKSEATFRAYAPERPSEYVRRPLPPGSVLIRRPPGAELPVLQPQMYTVTAKCARNVQHVQTFFILTGRRPAEVNEGRQTHETVLTKVGQYPSFADFHHEAVKRYRGSVPGQQLADLTRAINLAAHDIGIGAYVYLRRVFEWLIEDAHQVAMTQNDWDESAYTAARMRERIDLLRGHLPEFLVEHPQMYGLLSAGIHELTEKACLENFDLLRVAIELVLDERLEKREREAKIRRAKESLARVLGQQPKRDA